MFTLQRQQKCERARIMNSLIKNLPPLIIAQFTLSSRVKLKSRWPEIESDTRAPLPFLSLSFQRAQKRAPAAAAQLHCFLGDTFPECRCCCHADNFAEQKNETRAFLPRRLAAHGRVGGVDGNVLLFVAFCTSSFGNTL